MIRKKVIFSITSLLLIFVPCLFAQNLISNGQFEEGATGWEGWINSPTVDVDVIVDTTSKLSGKNSYLLVMHDADSVSYYIQRNINCPLELGHMYRISFLAIGVDSVGDSMLVNVLLEENGGDYSKRLNEWAKITDQESLYVFEVDYCAETDPGNQLKLHYGDTYNQGDSIWIDSVVVEDIGTSMDIVIDGFKDPFYQAISENDSGYIMLQAFHNSQVGPAPTGNADLSAEIWGAWDDEWFYIYAEVTDELISLDGAGNNWQTDAMELKIDGQPTDSTETAVSSSCIFTAIDSSEAEGTDKLVCDNITAFADEDKQYARGTKTNGYVLEYAIKLDTLGGSEAINAAVDSVFGLGINLIDNDGNSRQSAEVWASECSDNIWSTPKLHGRIRFQPDRKISFEATNNMTGKTNPLPYDGTVPAIVVDGQLDPMYKTLSGPEDGYIQLQWCHHSQVGTPENDADLSAKIYGAWDDEWLYLYADVTDDTISLDGAANNYETDAMELKIDGVPTDSTQAAVSSSCIFTAIDSSDVEGAAKLVCDNITAFADEDKQYARGTRTNGYILEYAIKIDTLGGSELIDAAVDSVFGLGINLIDNDGHGRQAAEVWAAICNDNIWNTVKYHGTVKFLADNKVEFLAVNNMTGLTNELSFDGSCEPPPPPVSINDNLPSVPLTYDLQQNYPNPFNPITTIKYSIPKAGKVKVVIYNILGQKVATLVDNKIQQAKVHEIQYDASHLATGLYFYSIEYSNKILTKKMLLIK
jgi:hypothetical protein